MSDDNLIASWAQLLFGIVAIVLLGIIVGAAGITSTSLLVGILLALLVHGDRS
jgi:hypothetical protein